MKEENFNIVKDFLLDLEKLSFEFANYFGKIDIKKIRRDDEELANILEELKKIFFVYFNDYTQNFTKDGSLESFLISRFNEKEDLFFVLEKVFSKLIANVNCLENCLGNLAFPKSKKLKKIDFIAFKVDKEKELILELQHFSGSKKEDSSKLKKFCLDKIENLFKNNI